MWNNAKRAAGVLAWWLVCVFGNVVMCTLAFVFVDFHMFFVFCTYAKRVVSDAISANVVCRCYMYGCIAKCKVIEVYAVL